MDENADRVEELEEELEEAEKRYKAAPETVTKMIRFREKFTFLNSPDCPDILKILVSDMFTAYGKYKEAFANLYAEKAENWANTVFLMGNVKEAKNLLKLAAELRGCYKDQQTEIPEELLSQKSTVIYTTSRKDLGVPEIDRKELEEFIDAIPEIPVIVRDNIKEDARIKAFDLKKRMLYDIKEFGEDNEGE